MCFDLDSNKIVFFQEIAYEVNYSPRHTNYNHGNNY